jgi:hypothetical protein
MIWQEAYTKGRYGKVLIYLLLCGLHVLLHLLLRLLAELVHLVLLVQQPRALLVHLPQIHQ